MQDDGRLSWPSLPVTHIPRAAQRGLPEQQLPLQCHRQAEGRGYAAWTYHPCLPLTPNFGHLGWWPCTRGVLVKFDCLDFTARLDDPGRLEVWERWQTG